MPNNVTTRMRIYGEKANDVLEAIKGEREAIDFEVIIPPPENMFRGSFGQKEKKLCQEEGRPNWYDWQRENWGTKWNAYSQSVTRKDEWMVEIEFDTAWQFPQPILDALQKQYPEVRFSGHWVEEFSESAGVF